MPKIARQWHEGVACPECPAGDRGQPGGYLPITEGDDLDHVTTDTVCQHQASLRDAISAAAATRCSGMKCPQDHPAAPLHPDVPEKPPQAWLCSKCGLWRLEGGEWKQW